MLFKGTSWFQEMTTSVPERRPPFWIIVLIQSWSDCKVLLFLESKVAMGLGHCFISAPAVLKEDDLGQMGSP